VSVDDSAGEDFKDIPILEGELMWESRIIDDTHAMLKAVRNVANRAIITDPTDAMALAVIDKLNQLGSDGWPDLNIADWRVLVKRAFKRCPDDPFASDLIEKISRFERD
jgi:hypothetical protein